jgi:hypothetical protein
MSKEVQGAAKKTETVKVMVRARPMNKKEIEKGKHFSTLRLSVY